MYTTIGVPYIKNIKWCYGILNILENKTAPIASSKHTAYQLNEISFPSSTSFQCISIDDKGVNKS